jgi:hypothetical protein
MKQTKIQLSLFPTYVCIVCKVKINHKGVCCKKCIDAWTKKIIIDNN